MTHRHGSLTRGMLAMLTAVLATLALGVSVAQAAPPETPVSQAPTSVTATSATLHGELNPGAATEEVSYHFAYNRGGECLNGSSIVEAPGTASGSKQKVSVALDSLVPSSEYTFCLVASNAAEESELSAPLSFTTAGAKPGVPGPGVVASAVTPFAATLEAVVEPENQPTTGCVFEYGLLVVSEHSLPCSPESLEGLEGQTVSAPLSGLSPGTTYLFRVAVENATGSTVVSREFTTLPLEAPIVSAESTASVASTDATVQAQVNPNYQETEFSFEFAASEQAVTEGNGTVVAGAPPAVLLPAVFEEQLAGPVDLGGGLAPRTVYFFRVLATNPSGATRGPIEQFKTTGAPVLTTAEAQNISRTSAVLSGTVDPGGEPTSYRYAYATDADYQPGEPNPYVKGGVTSQTQLPETDFAAHAAVPAPATELRPGTTYHYAIVASNAAGSTVGPDVEFTTAPPTPPAAVTGAASGVSQTSATLSGSVDTMELPTVAQFEFGTVPGAGFLVPATSTPGAGSTETLSAAFSGNLLPGTTYWFRTVAVNTDGTAFGAEVSFTTSGFGGQAGPPAAALISWPGFVLKELAEGPPKPGHGGPPNHLTNKQKLNKALKACNRKRNRGKRAGCRRAAKRRYR